jgi:hypothetical protein
MRSGSLEGPTKLFFFPFGARPDGDDVQKTDQYSSIFKEKASGSSPRSGSSRILKSRQILCAVICEGCTRMLTLRNQRDRYLGSMTEACLRRFVTDFALFGIN